MSNKQLENLVRIGRLKEEPGNDQEISGLMASGLARLNDARNKQLNIESRFDLAYNAAHALSLAALRLTGYRPEHRYIVFQCLKHTTGLSDEYCRVLDQAHRKRNIAEYEGWLDMDSALLEAMIRATDAVAELLQQQASPEGKA